MMRNETIYPDAATFLPERFMVPTTPEMERKMNPKNFVFGFGRRWVHFMALVWLDCSWTVSHICAFMSVAHCYERGCLSTCLCRSIFNLLFVDRLTSLFITLLLDNAREIISSILPSGYSSYRCSLHWISLKRSMTLGILWIQRWTIIMPSSGT